MCVGSRLERFICRVATDISLSCYIIRTVCVDLAVGNWTVKYWYCEKRLRELVLTVENSESVYSPLHCVDIASDFDNLLLYNLLLLTILLYRNKWHSLPGVCKYIRNWIGSTFYFVVLWMAHNAHGVYRAVFSMRGQLGRWKNQDRKMTDQIAALEKQQNRAKTVCLIRYFPVFRPPPPLYKTSGMQRHYRNQSSINHKGIVSRNSMNALGDNNHPPRPHRYN